MASKQSIKAKICLVTIMPTTPFESLWCGWTISPNMNVGVRKLRLRTPPQPTGFNLRFIMDNIDQLMHDPELSRVIQLNPSQYSFYRKTYIKILSPDGECLESIGHSPQKSLSEENFCHLREQISLLYVLFCNINESTEMSPMAIAGLAEVMLQMRRLCDGLVE